MTATHLSRATSATIIPAGDVVELPSGTAVTIVQTLGGNVTVRTDHGLFRIAAVDTEAIMDYEATAPQGGAEAVVEALVTRVREGGVLVAATRQSFFHTTTAGVGLKVLPMATHTEADLVEAAGVIARAVRDVVGA